MLCVLKTLRNESEQNTGPANSSYILPRTPYLNHIPGERNDITGSFFWTSSPTKDGSTWRSCLPNMGTFVFIRLLAFVRIQGGWNMAHIKAILLEERGADGDGGLTKG